MTWLVVFAVGAGSYVLRVGPLLALRRVHLSERMDRVIRHAGVAAIAALVAGGAKQAASGASVLPVLAALGCGAVLAARRASMLRIIALGGALYALLVVAGGSLR